MKEILKEIEQKCDDRVADFHNSLIILFLIQVISSLMIISVPTSLFMIFQDYIWMKLIGGIVLPFSLPIILNAGYSLDSATWHFWNTCDWFD